MVVGYFKADIAHPEGVEWYEDIVAALATTVLGDMLDNFLPR